MHSLKVSTGEWVNVGVSMFQWVLLTAWVVSLIPSRSRLTLHKYARNV